MRRAATFALVCACATALAAAACGGGSDSRPDDGARPTAASSSLARSSRTVVPDVTLQPVTPQPAAAAGRGDCPDGWSGYVTVSGALSFCFPPSWQLGVVRPAGASEAYALSDPENGTFITLSILDATPLTSGAAADFQALCNTFAAAAGITYSVEALQLQALSGSSCLGHGDAGDDGIDPVVGYVDLPDGKHLQVEVTKSSAGFNVRQSVVAVLKTVQAR
jgi:hypothetical protein